MSAAYSQEFVDRILRYEGAPRSIPDLLDPGLPEKILAAMAQANLPRVRELLAEDNGYGDPLLFWLLKLDQPGTERFISQSETGFDIFLASFFGLEARVRTLIASNPDLPHVRNVRGWTPLDVAAHEGHLEIVQLLLENGADPDTHQPMMWAAQNGYPEVVQVLLQAGTPQNKQRDALSRCVYRNRPDVMRVLLGAGVSPAGLLACAAYGARTKGKVDIMRTLIDHGAAANEKDEKGFNALYSQISFYGNGPNAEITEFLIENGAEIDIFNASGLGLLDELRDFIAADKTACHQRTSTGLTPLHYAAMGNQLAAAQLLVEAGADKGAQGSGSDKDRPVDKVREFDGHYVTCDTRPLRHFLTS